MREELVIDNPRCKLIPLVNGAAIDGDSPFDHLILARLKIRDDLLGNFCQVSAVNEIVRLQENRPQTRLSNWVVFQVELVESMERICVRLWMSASAYRKHFQYTHMHIERVNTKVVGSQIDTLEDLLQCEVFPIPEHHNLIGAFLHLALDESE